MGVDINQYRATIGTFVGNGSNKKSGKYEKFNETRRKSVWKLVKFLLLFFVACTLALAEVNKTVKQESVYSACIAEKHNLVSATVTTGGIKIEGRSINNCRTFLKKEHNGVQYYQFSNLDNHFSKYTNGNRKHGGIRIYHFNKGNAHLCNKIHEVENIISTHRPHILGISESNYFQDHDYDAVQIENYKFLTAKTINNPNLKVSRVCVYLHKSMVGKIREDLMDENFSSIWVEVGLPQKRKILIGNVYREWGFMRQDNPAVSHYLTSQKDRWSVFIEQWERALAESKEVIVLGDLNLNFLEWARDDLPPNNQTQKLKPLIAELFSRILPHGVSQLVKSATRIRVGQPESGLDHFYSNEPNKLSPVQVVTCGGSDHKLIGATRYSSKIKKSVRYVTKRCYKHFNREQFISEVRKINWWQIYECEDVELVLQILTDNLTNILDQMAPIRTIQIRENYAPWLSQETKNVMTERDIAQQVAATSKFEDDWKIFKRLRNKVISILKNEKINWQRNKFKKCEDEKDSKQIWKNIKSWLNWTTSGAPTQLFYEGRLESCPSGLADCMNRFFIEKVSKLRNNLGQSEDNPLDNLQQLMSNLKCVFKL